MSHQTDLISQNALYCDLILFTKLLGHEAASFYLFAETDPEIFACGVCLRYNIFENVFTIYLFSLIVLDAISHYVLCEKNLCFLSVNLARCVARNLQWGAIWWVWGLSPQHSKILHFFSKNNLILGLF